MKMISWVKRAEDTRDTFCEGDGVGEKSRGHGEGRELIVTS